MKVIFLEDDRIEEVSAGYARNYLLPRKVAVSATAQAVAAVAKRKEKKQAEVTAKRAELQALAEKLGATEIEIKADVGEGGKLFGSVTTQDIARAAKQSAGVELDRKKIDLLEPIRLVGEYTIPAKLFQEITAHLKIKVTAR